MHLLFVHLLSAHLLSVHLLSAHLLSAHLLSAHLLSVHLLSAHLLSAHLLFVHLLSAHLLSVHLLFVHLLSAYLLSAHLLFVYLLFVHLLSAHLLFVYLLSGNNLHLFEVLLLHLVQNLLLQRLPPARTAHFLNFLLLTLESHLLSVPKYLLFPAPLRFLQYQIAVVLLPLVKQLLQQLLLFLALPKHLPWSSDLQSETHNN